MCVVKTLWSCAINNLRTPGEGPLSSFYACYNVGLVLGFILALLAAIRVFFRSRGDTALEVLALRQQVAVLKRKRPRPRLNRLDRFFWTSLRQVWRRWADVLVVVKPETVISWHRAGFRLYWRWRSQSRGGRPKITHEIRALIRRMADENAGYLERSFMLS